MSQSTASVVLGPAAGALVSWPAFARAKPRWRLIGASAVPGLAGGVINALEPIRALGVGNIALRGLVARTISIAIADEF
jgi:hypothetical protein